MGQLRCASKFYASVGRPFMFRQLHLIFTPHSFRRLQAIASDPTLAPYVTTLFYEADTLPKYRPYADWVRRVFHPTILSGMEHIELLEMPGPDSTARSRRAYQRELWKLKEKSRLELSTAYKKYLNYLEEQQVIRVNNYNAREIADAMAQLPNLVQIIFSLEQWAGERSENVQNTYSDSHTKLCGHNDWTAELGVPQLFSLLRGSVRTHKKLKSLSGGFVDLRFIMQGGDVSRELQKAVRHLQELKLGFSAFSTCFVIPQDEINSGYVKRAEATTFLEYGYLQDFLAAAPNLRLLDLRFNWSSPDSGADLRYIVGNHRWEFLADVTLSNFECRAADLVGFCERHAMTLQRLVIDDVELFEDSWAPTFQKMRRLLHLQQVKIRGDLMAYEFRERWSFTRMESRHETTMGRVVQEYLLQGGDGPLLDLDEHDKPTDQELENFENLGDSSG
ncbi:hypothetical protein MMC07_007629 [Pseudocyphellaria aurata]|nr:hypothetical protein [Pseudocyphellaria aurata]